MNILAVKGRLNEKRLPLIRPFFVCFFALFNLINNSIAASNSILFICKDNFICIWPVLIQDPPLKWYKRIHAEMITECYE